MLHIALCRKLCRHCQTRYCGLYGLEYIIKQNAKPKEGDQYKSVLRKYH